MTALPPWSDTTIARVEKKEDHDRASNGWSRYASYVQAREEKFWEWGDRDKPLPDAEFTVQAWRIATSPVMSPGYVDIRPDLLDLSLHAGSDGQRLYVSCRVPLAHGDLTRRLPPRWRDREPYRTWWGDDHYTPMTAPEAEPGKPPVVVLNALIEYARDDWELLVPGHTTGDDLAADCIAAIDVIVPQLNSTIGPMVQVLLQGEQRAALR